VHVLDNPAWHALAGPQKTVADGGPLAFRYEADVAPFSAVPDDPQPEHWAALRALVGDGAVAVFMRTALEPPPGWVPVFDLPAVQMVASESLGPPADDEWPVAPPVALTDADVPEMVALVERTNPGPFSSRTIALGRYIGVRDGGTLVAMAGERMRLPGYTEISAVCTAPEYRGRGLAAALVRDLSAVIAARGDTPMLHVVHGNERAARVYRALGFEDRADLSGIGLRAPRE
jgi:ribosomal protein S18 acetylase RimI-like enzyme